MLQTIVFSQIAGASGVRRFTWADFFRSNFGSLRQWLPWPGKLCHPYRKTIAYCAKARPSNVAV